MRVPKRYGMDFGALSGDQGLSIEVTLLHTWGNEREDYLAQKEGTPAYQRYYLAPALQFIRGE